MNNVEDTGSGGINRLENKCQSCFHDKIGIIEQEENRTQVKT